MIETIELILSKVMLVLFTSLPLLWGIQLFRLGFSNLKNNRRKIAVVPILWFCGSFLLVIDFFSGSSLVFSSISVLIFMVGVISLAFWKSSKETTNKEYMSANNYIRWNRAWIVVLIINTLIFWVLERELGSRGPLEITIEVDESNKKDFVVSTIYYIGGHTSFSSFKYQKVVKAGEKTVFPNSYVGFNFFMELFSKNASTREIEIVVSHPEYEIARKFIDLTYNFPRITTKKTIHLNHWDIRFLEMEKKVQSEPEKTLLYRVGLGEDFVHHIGSIRRMWIPIFSLQENIDLKKKYLPWIENLRRKYPEMKCYSKRLKECEEKLKKGELGEYKNTLPWS